MVCDYLCIIKIKTKKQMKTIDITTLVTPELIAKAQSMSQSKAFQGHLGTHFDVMNKEFPLSYTELEAVVFDVSHISVDTEITLKDVEVSKIKEGSFVTFYSGFIEREGYATNNYFKHHPQLSFDLIHFLIEKKIAIIGVDFAGIRRGEEHTKTDQLCADHDVFVVENLCNLSVILKGHKSASFVAGTYPVHFSGQTGLPCRVVARVEE